MNSFALFCFAILIAIIGIIQYSVLFNESFHKYVMLGDSSDQTDINWFPPPTLIPLEVRHKMWDSGGDQRHLDDVIAKQTNETIKILIWRRIYAATGLEYGSGRTPFKYFNCPVSNCEVYNDPNLLNESHAVFFHMPTFKPKLNPTFRSPNQKWILFGKESPRRFYYPLQKQHFNITMTYRQDSDIFVPYDYIRPRSIADPPISHNFAVGKSRIVYWMSSNCDSTSRRLNYVKELGKHIDVAIYGACGNLTCRSKNESCNEYMNATYKFYIAFENSICIDYVTEKLYRTLHWDVVPIVLGGANYSAILPRKSYIDIRDFASPKELAKYLIYLDKNDTKYNEYFTWRRYYEFHSQPRWGQILCSLCHGLHNYRDKIITYPELPTWWSSSCLNRTLYFQNHAPSEVYTMKDTLR